MLKCDVCASALTMNADGESAVCKTCGMNYSIERLRAMFRAGGGEISASKGREEPLTESSDFDIRDGCLVKYKGRKKHVIIPEGVEIIDSYAFKANSVIEGISIPKTLTEIKDNAFDDCPKFSEIHAEDARTMAKLSFEGGAHPEYSLFIGGEEVRDLVLENVGNIANGAFYRCRSLRSVSLGAGIEGLVNAFSSSAVERVRISGSVKAVSGFSSCKSLRSVEIGEGVEIIGENAFSFSGIEEIKIPSSVKEIGLAAFRACHSLSKIDLGDGVRKIGSYAFAECAPEDISFPKSLREICSTAFLHCEKLASVRFSEGLTTIGSSAFSHTGIKNIVFPESLASLDHYAFSGTNLETVYFKGEALPFYSYRAKVSSPRLDREREIETKRLRREAGLCQHCGGEISFFGRTCKECGVKRDY